MIFKRKIYEELLHWKRTDEGRTAVLIQGARRVGKSTIAEEFAAKEYETYILVDFAACSTEIRDLFNDVSDLNRIFMRLQFEYGVELKERKSVIIFDEVQLAPKARQAIKYLVKDGRYDYIETGSLISIRKNVRDILIPSEETKLYMYPMDYEEFRWALGDTATVKLLQGCFLNRTSLGDATNRKLMRDFRLYMLVGGMPQAVAAYMESGDFEQVDRVKRRILGLYRGDIGKWPGENTNHVRNIFDRIPEELNRKDKVFTLSTIDKNARMREYEDSFMWLVDGRIVNLCLNSNNPEIGLSVYSDRPTLKCYMADTGLLVTHAYSDRRYLENELYKDVLLNGIGVNEGMVMENVVAQTLVSLGDRLFFYSRGRNDPDGQMEIDFLIRRGGGICPVEVKSSNRSRDHKSLDDFRRRFGKRLGQSYVIHSKDLSVENGIVYLPAYMAMFV